VGAEIGFFSILVWFSSLRRLTIRGKEKRQIMSIKMDLRPAQHDPVNCKVLTQRHLNFDVRYQVKNNVITHKVLLFNTNQVHTSVAKCCGGKCVLALCRLAENKNGQSVEDFYDPTRDMEDHLIGKMVKVNGLGEMTFHDLDGSHPNLDLNWKRLRNLAQPVVDEALARMAMAGKWERQPIKLNLGVLLVDHTVIRIDNQSYAEMEKDKEKDMKQCEVSWNRQLEREKEKRGITSVGGVLAKQRKWKTVHKRDSKGNESSWTGGGFKKAEDECKTVKEEENGEDKENNQPLLQVEAPVEEEKMTAGESEPEEKWEECVECRESPCVWVGQRDVMILFDEMEHAHLPQEDLPPNNIRRKKVYRQMTLFIQEGQVQKGVRHVLPACVEEGTRLLFPSPTFMGFMSS
jgi:hypothetical protein